MTDTAVEAHIRLEESVQYLCRILCVFEGLFRGITADDLRGKFVSGLVLSGLTPEATGRRWLDLFDVVRGVVVIFDNELHGETIAYRLRTL